MCICYQVDSNFDIHPQMQVQQMFVELWFMLTKRYW